MVVAIFLPRRRVERLGLHLQHLLLRTCSPHYRLRQLHAVLRLQLLGLPSLRSTYWYRWLPDGVCVRTQDLQRDQGGLSASS